MSNIYQSILPLNEFVLKDKETQKLLLTKWREVHSNKTIMEQMNIKGNQAFANLIKDLGVPKKKVKTGGRKAKLITDSPTVEKINATQTPPATQEIKEMPVMLPEIINGLKLAYHGEYTADELARLFTKLQLLTDGEKSKFRIALSLMELTEK